MGELAGRAALSRLWLCGLALIANLLYTIIFAGAPGNLNQVAFTENLNEAGPIIDHYCMNRNRISTQIKL